MYNPKFEIESNDRTIHLFKNAWFGYHYFEESAMIQSLDEHEQASVFNGLYGNTLDKCLPCINLK